MHSWKKLIDSLDENSAWPYIMALRGPDREDETSRLGFLSLTCLLRGETGVRAPGIEEFLIYMQERKPSDFTHFSLLARMNLSQWYGYTRGALYSLASYYYGKQDALMGALLKALYITMGEDSNQIYMALRAIAGEIKTRRIRHKEASTQKKE